MDIVLYSNNCPKCNILKKKLAEKNIEYTECNDIDTMVALGISCVPVLGVNGTLMDFKDAVIWLKGCED